MCSWSSLELAVTPLFCAKASKATTQAGRHIYMRPTLLFGALGVMRGVRGLASAAAKLEIAQFPCLSDNYGFVSVL